MAVTKGSKIKVHYTGKLTDGTVFDRSQEDKPIEFVVGNGNLIPGFENAVCGMNPGETKTIEIKTEEAYGQKDETLIRKFPKDIIKDGTMPQKGMVIKIFLKNGGVVPATVQEVTETDIIVDLNHPLAGKDLIFEITIAAVE